jgi:hypothetical protein
MENEPLESCRSDAHAQAVATASAPALHRGFFERHGAAIQSICTVVGLIIAYLMLKSLHISESQLEASIEPRIDMTWHIPPQHANWPIPAVTHDVMGIPWSNSVSAEKLTSTQLEEVVTFMTNLTRITIRNCGAVGVSDVELVMRLEANLDDRGTVTNAVFESTAQMLAAKLAPNEEFVHDFGDDPALERLVTMRGERAKGRVACYVIRYRRVVDKKPKFKLMCFEAFTIATGRLIVMPIGVNYRSFYPNGIQPPRVIKSALMKFLDQLDVTSPVDDQ